MKITKFVYSTTCAFALMALLSSCQTKSNETAEQREARVKAGGCVKCQCNGWLDTNGDDKCETIRNNDNTQKCQHGNIDH